VQGLRIGIAVVVTAVWTATYGKYLVAGGASPPAELSGLMFAVVTWALGAELRDAVKKRGDEGGD
jgi:hypothetical protein